MPRGEQEIPADCVTCIRCGWVSFAVTRADAEAHVEKHNRWRLEEPSRLRHWPTPAVLDSYRCRGCGQWGPYRRTVPGDCPTGATLNAVVCEHAE